MSKRDISPFLKAMRNVLLGRKHKTALRFQQDIAPRTADPPNLPDGPHHILSANYYYARDGRRDVKPPEVIYEFGPKRLAAGNASDEKPKEITSGKTPGNLHFWD